MDGNTPTGTSTQDAAVGIAALLNDDLLPSEPTDTAPAGEAAATSEPVETPEVTPEPATEPPAPASEPIRILLDGEEVDEHTIRSWKQEDEKAKLRQSDYTRKTQEVAEARKAFEAEQVQVRQTYAAKLKAL